MLPDRLHFTGDFLLRHGAAANDLDPRDVFPQAFPLDVFLHHDLPRGLLRVAAIPVAVTERTLGALEAGALAALAVGFARVLGLRGAAALAAVSVLLLGGYLGIYTGYGKAVAEMAVIALALAVLGLRSRHDPAALLPFGLCLAVALTLHRSAVAFLPPAAAALWLARGAPTWSWRSPLIWLALAIPVLTLAALAPRVVGTMARWDAVHFVSSEVAEQGGILGAAVKGRRMLDVLNVMLLLSPLALAIPVLAWVRGSRGLGSPAAVFLVLLALPWTLLAAVIQLPQGIYRDWDNFAVAALKCSIAAACLIGLALRDRPRWGWLGLAAALGALAPTVQWLALNGDLERGLGRVRTLVTEPPLRTASARGTTWDFLGIRYGQMGRWDAAAAALARAAETAPSPRVLTQWAMAERSRGDYHAAQRVFARLTRLTPSKAEAWFGLAAASWKLGDYDECRRATMELARLEPGDPVVARMLMDLERARHPDGAVKK